MTYAVPLPRYTRPLIGREAAWAALADGLASASVVTVLGPGGVGKTRLAVAFAEAWRAGTVWFIDLQSARSGADFRAALSRATGVGPGERLVARLRTLDAPLLVLDNFEQLVDEGAELVQRFAEQVPDALWVVTSRRPLGIRLERLVHLTPFPIPDEIGAARVPQLRAAQIFRAAAPPGADLSAPLQTVLRQLDGLPLAMQLAAARLEVMALPQLDARLKARPFAVLRRPEPRGARHDSLWSTIEWSWDLLDKVHQDVLRQCVLFAGGFTLVDAEQVFQVPADVALLDVLHALCRHQLLCFDGARFSLLESIRLFLNESGPPDPVLRERHARWCVQHAERFAEQLFGPDIIGALDQLSALFFDLKRVVRAPHPLAWRAARALTALLNIRGPIEGRVAFLDEVLARTEPSPLRATLTAVQADWLRIEGRYQRAQQQIDQVLDDPTCSNEARAKALAVQGLLMLHFGKPSDAAPFYHQAAALSQEDPALACSYQVKHALAFSYQGHDAQARALGRQAVAAARALNSPLLEDGALSSLGTILNEQGRFEEGIAALTEALTIEQTLGNVRKQGFTLGLIGLSQANLGQFDDARQALSRAITMLQSVGTTQLIASYQGSLGQLRLLQPDRRQEACALLEQAVALGAGGQPHLLEEFQLWLSAGYAIQGRPDAAVASISGDLENPFFQCVSPWLPRIAHAFSDRGTEEGRFQEVDAALTALSVEADWPLDQRLLALLREEIDQRSRLWIISQDGTWFQSPGSAPMSLTHRPTHARVLAALAHTRHMQPGASLNTAALARAGWPDERILPRAAANRVRVTISGLREAGLRPLIQRRRNGWVLDPDTPIAIHPPEAPLR
ncbi:MAG: tetratricopeptide repeat protein [Myxococcota bacterium]